MKIRLAFYILSGDNNLQHILTAKKLKLKT